MVRGRVVRRGKVSRLVRSAVNSTDPAADTEIERKYIVKALPYLNGLKGTEIVQGYIAVGKDGTEVRLRRYGDRYFETVKVAGDLSRREMEVEISHEQFDTLWAATEGKRLEKVRYEIDYYDHKIELDVYRGSLAGLNIAEIEFRSEQESVEFTPPTWFYKEVTKDPAFKNSYLATRGRPANI